jgi:hypothetical protein
MFNGIARNAINHVLLIFNSLKNAGDLGRGAFG